MSINNTSFMVPTVLFAASCALVLSKSSVTFSFFACLRLGMLREQ